MTIHAGTINLCVKKREQGVTSALTFVEITCYDEDFLNFDDQMVGPQGNSLLDGCATMFYDNKNWDDFFADPDIYCEIDKNGYRRVSCC